MGVRGFGVLCGEPMYQRRKALAHYSNARSDLPSPLRVSTVGTRATVKLEPLPHFGFWGCQSEKGIRPLEAEQDS